MVSPGLTNARLAGARVAGASGRISGPCDISDTATPHMVDSDDLKNWFAKQQAQLEVDS